VIGDDHITVRSSRLWALFHFNLTQWIFPAYMLADHVGISTKIVRFWLTPWRSVDEHLPLSHVAEVIHIRGFLWMRSGSRVRAAPIHCLLTACRNRRRAISSSM
jgi:hypothetical protein